LDIKLSKVFASPKLFISYIYFIYMKKTKVELKTELKIKGILGFMRKKVTPFGTGAKVDCPKEYLGKTVYLVTTKE